MIEQLKSLINQLQLFCGIHTAEAALIEDQSKRIAKLESDLADLAAKHDQLHGKVIANGNTIGVHLRTHK